MTSPALARSALLATTSLGFLIVGSGAAILGPALPVFVRDFGLSTSAASAILSIQWFGCVLGVVAMYFLSERLTVRPGLVLIAAGAGLLAMASSYVTTLLGGLVFGLGYGAIAVQFNPRVLVAYGARGPQMLSAINAAFSAGAILAPYGFVLMGGSPRPVFTAMAVLALLCLIPATVAGMTGVTHQTAKGRGFRPYWPILILGFLASGIEVTLAGLGPTALIRMGVEETEAARMLSQLFTVSLGARLVLIGLANRVPAFGLYTFGVAWAAAMAICVLLFGPSPFFAAFGVATGLFFQGVYVTAQRKMGDDPRVPAIILGNGLAGAAVAPLIYAPMMDRLGDQGYFWMVAVVASGLTLAALASYRTMTR